MGLYRIDLDFSFYVEADSESAALARGARNAKAALSESLLEDSNMYAREMNSVNQLPNVWKDSIPYASVDDSTCRQILSKAKT